MRKTAPSFARLDARAPARSLRALFAADTQMSPEPARFVLLEGAQVAVGVPRGRPVLARDPRHPARRG